MSTTMMMTTMATMRVVTYHFGDNGYRYHDS
jgi:hypothetical protein